MNTCAGAPVTAGGVVRCDVFVCIVLCYHYAHARIEYAVCAMNGQRLSASAPIKAVWCAVLIGPPPPHVA